MSIIFASFMGRISGRSRAGYDGYKTVAFPVMRDPVLPNPLRLAIAAKADGFEPGTASFAGTLTFREYTREGCKVRTRTVRGSL